MFTPILIPKNMTAKWLVYPIFFQIVILSKIQIDIIFDLLSFYKNLRMKNKKSNDEISRKFVKSID